MITRIEIDGFKSFHNFKVDLNPFQVLIGPNGVGKSNLFDAIVLLSNLAGDNTLYDAFRKNRGEVGELFTILPNGERARTMRFAVELLVGKNVTDDLGVTEPVSSTRLRYELVIESQVENRLHVIREQLQPIIGDDDEWVKNNIPRPNQKSWIVRSKGRRGPYISTDATHVNKHQDGRQGGKQQTPLGRIERTVLSSISSAEYPTAYAVKQEMLNWQFLQLDPLRLRTPSHVYDKTTLKADGSNLAAVLWRMSQEEEYALKDVSIDMANIVPGILEITVKPVKERQEYLVEATTNDGEIFSSRVLSDGTLRLLALVALSNDPNYKGVLCFEEPENGVNTLRLDKMVDVLKSLATDFEDTEEDDVPRQVLINTHSARLMSSVDEKFLLFMYMSGRVPRRTQAAHLSSEMFPDEDKMRKKFIIAQVRRYLDSSSLDEQRNRLAEIESGI
jgi:predicted ATPase